MFCKQITKDFISYTKKKNTKVDEVLRSSSNFTQFYIDFSLLLEIDLSEKSRFDHNPSVLSIQMIRSRVNLTTKGNRHIEHFKNATREWVDDGTITVAHVSDKCNPSDLFTKEMRDGANFRRIRESFMSRASTFLKGIYNSLHPLSPQHLERRLDVAAQAAHFVPPPQPGLLDVLLSHQSFRTSDALSCLSHAGRYILSRACLSGRLL